MKKILLIRFSSIGDIVLTTPVIRCLKNQLGAEIHFLTKRPFLPLLEANPHLDKIFTIENKIVEVLPILKSEHYDYIIDLHKNLRSFQVQWALHSKTFSFDKLNFEKWLLVNFRINRLPKIHIVDRYFQATKPIDVVNDGQGLDYYFPKNFNGKLPAQGIKYIAIAIGAAHQTKRLPTKKIIELCKKSTLPVQLLGGSDEANEGEQISKDAGNHVTNYCGKLSLHESAKIIQHAHLVITHDSGMMHIAAAFQKEIVSIWGSTVTDFGMTPYYGDQLNKNQTFQVEGLSCRPCTKIGFAKCPKGHFRCMVDQDTNAIVQIHRNVQRL